MKAPSCHISFMCNLVDVDSLVKHVYTRKSLIGACMLD